MKQIDLRTALDILHGGTWVSLAAVQADENRATGGKILRLPRAKLMRRTAPVPVPTVPTVPPSATNRKENNPYFTRTITTPGGDILTIHPLLIFEINGHHVI